MRPEERREIAELALADHPVATLVADISGRLILANRSARRLLAGPGDADRAGADLTGWSGPYRTLPEILADAARSSNWIPVRLVRGGAKLHLRARGLRPDDGSPPCVLLTEIPDATRPFMAHARQLKQLNDQLAIRHHAEARLDFALQAGRLGIWEHDLKAGVVWRSARHDDIFGYDEVQPSWSREKFLGHVVPEDRESVRATIERRTARGEPFKFQCRIRRVDGEVRWIAAEAAPTLDGAGKVVRINGVISDVTEEKLTERRMATADRMQALGHMAGGLAHDFSNVIGIIRLSAEVARMSGDPEEMRGHLDAILQAAERGAALTARTLAFARREPGVVQTIPLGPLVSEIVDLTVGNATSVAPVHSEIGEDLCVECDPGQLENVLLNLLLNAREAIAASGLGDRIDITAHRDAGHGMIEITVADNGPGMTAEVLGRAPEPFFTTKQGAGGTGLGLATVAAFSASAGGDLTIRSNPGEGTVVTISLPAANPDGTAAVAEPGPAKIGADRRRILMLEDDAQFRKALQAALESMGYRVTTASAGVAALSLLEGDAEFDVVVTDVLLPGGMNGFQFAAQARSLRPDLPVVYVSGYADDSFQAGAPRGPFLRKPVGRDEIHAAIQQVLGEA